MSSLSWNAVAPQSFPPRLQEFHEKKAAILRHVAGSERLIEVRPASRLEIRPRPAMLSSGIPALDALTGGIPRGCLTEIYGTASSGKTSVLLSTMAATTRRGESCVLIDASDSFDPSSAAKAGMEFGKLLWVRCGSSSVVGRRSSAKLFPENQKHASPHAEISALHQGSSNKANDQRPMTDDLQRLPRTPKQSSERRLEQVLKTTDLILQSGGFGLVALDLAGIPQKFVRRIPLASWFRFQRTVEHTKTALLVVSEFPCVQTCAALAVKVANQPSTASHPPSGKPAHAQIFEGLRVEADVTRNRLERKPMQSVRAVFESKAIRAG